MALKKRGRPPHSLPENYHDLCIDFILANIEDAAHDFYIPELVQATFYAMVVNEALELGVLIKGIPAVLKSTLTGL